MSKLLISNETCLASSLKKHYLVPCFSFSEPRLYDLQYDGELYLLATDQGYINQPDLVWEKLNEVRL